LKTEFGDSVLDFNPKLKIEFGEEVKTELGKGVLDFDPKLKTEDLVVIGALVVVVGVLVVGFVVLRPKEKTEPGVLVLPAEPNLKTDSGERVVLSVFTPETPKLNMLSGDRVVLDPN